MEQAISDLFILLTENIYGPFQRQIANTPFLMNLIRTINLILNKILDAFHDTATETTIDLFNDKILSALITVFIEIWFFSIFVKIFKLSFKTLKNVYLSIIEVGPMEKGSSKTWRKQWRRKKWK